MSKARWAQGLRTGSTKTTTYSTLSTQKEGRVQIIKDRVYEVTNPRTRNQMIVRVCLSTVSQAAAFMANLIEISREGVTNRRFARQQFISENCSFLQSVALSRGGLNMHPYAVFAPKNNKQLIPNGYIVSKGSLEVKDFLVPKVSGGQSFGSSTWSNVNEGNAIGSMPFGTYKASDFWEMLFGLRPGDQLSVPQIIGNNEVAQTLTDGAGNILDKTVKTKFVCPRLVLLANMPQTDIVIDSNFDNEALVAALRSGIDTEQSFPTLVENFVDAWTIDDMADDTMLVTCEEPYSTIYGIPIAGAETNIWHAMGVILSRKDADGKWKFSTSQLTCTWNWLGTGPSYYFGFLLDSAIETYAGGSSLTADGNFLQAGGDADIIPEDFM